jgi:hypothetical protein
MCGGDPIARRLTRLFSCRAASEWALTQALRAADDRQALAMGNEVSYQVSFRAPNDQALHVKVIAFGGLPILQWFGWPSWSASIFVPEDRAGGS